MAWPDLEAEGTRSGGIGLELVARLARHATAKVQIEAAGEEGSTRVALDFPIVTAVEAQAHAPR